MNKSNDRVLVFSVFLIVIYIDTHIFIEELHIHSIKKSDLHLWIKYNVLHKLGKLWVITLISPVSESWTTLVSWYEIEIEKFYQCYEIIKAIWIYSDLYQKLNVKILHETETTTKMIIQKKSSLQCKNALWMKAVQIYTMNITHVTYKAHWSHWHGGSFSTDVTKIWMTPIALY